MKPKLLIFDFWKTIAFSPEKDPREFYAALKGFGIEIKNKEEAKKFSSLFSKYMCLSTSWKDFSEKLLEAASAPATENNIKKFADFLKKNIQFRIYEDAGKVSSLPYKKVILTDSGRFIIESSPEVKGFSRIFTPQETGALKPDPQVFSTVIKEMNVEPKETVMIGDDPKRDIKPAASLGMKTILIDRKNKYPNYSQTKINSFQELKEALEGL